MSMEEQKDGDQMERLQYLHVQSTTQERVNNAVDRIKAIIAGETTNKQYSNQQQQHYVQDKVFIGMDQAPESFKLLDRLSGPGGSYLAHIAEQTGAKVYLRGKGSGFLEPTSGREAFEALYLYISHPTHNGMTQAKKLCESLVSTVRKELQQFSAPLGYATIPPPVAVAPPPAAAAGGGAYTYMQQPPFYASYQMGSRDPRMLPPQQYGGQPFPLANSPPQGAGMTAPPFPPYFGAVPPYIGAPPPQPFVASSVPPHPYAVPPQTGPIPPLLPPAVTTTQSETTSVTGEYSVSSADGNKISSSNNVYSSAQSPATTSTGESLPPPAPNKPAKRRFTEKPNVQAEVLKSSLSVNAYTDVSSEVTQSVDDALGNGRQDRVANQESKVDESDAEIKKDETKEYKLINTDEKSESHIKKDDKWKPIIDDSEQDKMLMPPPGSFPRLPAGQRMSPKQKEFVKPKENEFVKPKENELLKSEEDESLKDEDDGHPAKKLKLVVYGDSDSDND